MSIDKNILHDIINSNPEAKKLADKGDDNGVLKLIYSSLPKEVVPNSLFTELGVIGAFGSPDDANECFVKLEALAEANPPFKRVMKWLGPGSNGLDFGNMIVRSQLDSIMKAGILTESELAILKSLGEKTVNVTVNDISNAWARYRGN